MKILIILLILCMISIPITFAEQVPDWVKNTAGWWATDAISEKEFVNAVEFLVNDGIIIVENSTSLEESHSVPDWVKNTAGWWATDAISEKEFVNAVSYLIKIGIINIEQQCKFETDEFSNLSVRQTWLLCNVDHEYLDDWVTGTHHGWDDSKEREISGIDIQLNSHGFRGDEFSKEKDDNTIRIFAVGGSTTYGFGVPNESSYPFLLQQKINSLNLEKKVEVINAGVAGAWSKMETDLIKDKLIEYEPDIFIIYDGWYEIQNHVFSKNTDENMWKTRWSEICELGKENNFSTVITLQPLVWTTSKEKRLAADQEMIILNSRLQDAIKFNDAYKKYPEKLEELNADCKYTENLLNLFGETHDVVFYDYAHVNALGNNILADKMLEITSKILKNEFDLDVSSNMDSSDYSNIKRNFDGNTDFRGKNFANVDFSNKNLENAVFYYANLQNVDFSGANLENVEFRFSNLQNVDFSDANLKNAKFARGEINGINFSNADLENTHMAMIQMKHGDLSNTNLENAEIKGSKIFNFITRQTNFKSTLFMESMIVKLDFRVVDLTNAKFVKMEFIDSNFKDMDLSSVVFEQRNMMANSNLDGVILPREFTGIDFSSKVFNQQDTGAASVVNVDFRDIVIDDMIFGVNTEYDEDIEFMHLWREKLGPDFTGANFSDVDLSGKNLSLVNFNSVNFSGANLSNTNLQFSDLSNVNLNGANLEGALLENAILPNTNLNCINHEICIKD